MRKPSSKVRPLFRFRILTLLLCITLFAVWLGRATFLANRQRDAVAELTSQNLRINYDYQHQGDLSFSYKQKPPGPEWLRRFVGEDYFQRAINVSTAFGGPIDHEGMAVLEKLPKLEGLWLTASKITDADLRYLEEQKETRSLNLEDNNLTDAGLAHLKAMRNLETLTLSENQIQGEGLRILRGMPQLRTLFIYETPLTDIGLHHIAEAANLEMLGLGNTQITDEGISHLSKLNKLEYLSAGNTSLSDASIEHFVKMKSLRDLELHNTKLTPEGIERLRKEMPNCRVNGKGGGDRPSELGPYAP